MELTNLIVARIIIHQIYKRNEDGQVVTPLQSHEYTNFDQEAMETFRKRVFDSLGEKSKAVPMEIVHQEANSISQIVDSMADQNDQDFAVSSYDIASKLATAQQTRSIPGGIVVIFSGTFGANSKRFLGIIKAEIHSGYEKIINQDTNEISLKFVEEVLLTPGTRLYKTAGFFEKTLPDNTQASSEEPIDMNNKWAVLVSDHQIRHSEGKAAANYFLSDFLGFGYPDTSARTTRRFYESTKKFISSMDVTSEEKSDLYNALTTYLKVDTSSSISSNNFAEQYLSDLDLQDSYVGFMTQEGLPSTAFTKDIEHIKDNLKLRKVSFKNNVKLSAPSDVFRDFVLIETIEGETDEAGNPAEWTKIIIKDKIARQE